MHPGTSFTDALTGYHLHPISYVKEILSPWTDKVYLGEGTGAMQVALVPGALLYAGLHAIGVGPADSQRLYFFILFLVAGLSVAWFLRTLTSRFSSIPAVVAVAPVLYVLNLYVAYTMVGNSPTLWPYALLPAMLAIATLAINEGPPLRYALVGALLSVPMAGTNAALDIINIFVLAAYIGFLIWASADRGGALRRTAAFCGAILPLAIICNLYWIGPFIYYAKTVWLDGVFSESIAWHSSLANVPDILRLLGGEGFFASAPGYGWFYPYQHFYRDGGLVEACSLAIPLIAFSVLLFRRGRAEPLIRFFTLMTLAAVIMASGAHSGTDGGAWTGNLFGYISDHVRVFQIFRDLEKWDAVVSLGITILCTYWVGLVVSGLRRFGPVRAAAAAFVLPVIAVIGFLPVLQVGPFRPQSTLKSLPAYWEASSSPLPPQPGQRTALLPAQYLPHYFWGEVLPDFAGIALQRPVTSSIARSTGAPTEGTAFAIEAMYRGIALGAPWTASLLERLSVARLFEQRDAYYLPDQESQSPAVQLAELSSIKGIHRLKDYGDLSEFGVRGAAPVLAYAHGYLVPFNGDSLLSLFGLLRPDEVALNPTSSSSSADLPKIRIKDNYSSLAASMVSAIFYGHVRANAVSFTLQQDENVRVFARTAATASYNASSRFTIDGASQIGMPPSDDWSEIAAFRGFAGRHTIAPFQPQAASDVEIRVVDANAYDSALESLRQAGDVGELAVVPQKGLPFSVPAAGSYSVRARALSSAVRNYSFPLNFDSYARPERDQCAELPLVVGPSALELDLAPPENWYHSDALLRLTQRGRILTSWYQAQTPIKIFNPFDGPRIITIAGNIGALGQDRSLTLWDPKGVPTHATAELHLASDIRLAQIDRMALSSPVYVSLIGEVQRHAYQIELPKGWSTVTLVSSGGDGLPNRANLLNGFIDYGSIGPVEASACGIPARSPSARETHGDQRIVAHADSPRITGIRLPNVSLGQIPFLTVHVDAASGPELHAIAYYETRHGESGSYPVFFSESGSQEQSASLEPVSQVVPATARLSGLDLIVGAANDSDVAISSPRLTLERTNVTQTIRAAIASDRSGTIIRVRGTTDRQTARLVISYHNADDTERDVAFASNGGWYVGRSVELARPSVHRLSDRFAELTFAAPSEIPRKELDLWRGQIRMFYGARELTPALSAVPLPGQFGGGSSLSAVLPSDLISRGEKWHVVYVPGDWFAPSRQEKDTDEIRLPLADALTDVYGDSRPLGDAVKVISKSSAPDVSAYRYPLTISTAFVEKPDVNDRSSPRVVGIDGRDVNLVTSGYGWNSATVNLTAGLHELRSTTVDGFSVLILPAGSVPKKPVSSGQIPIDTDRWTAALYPASSRSASTVAVLREAFSPGWQLTDGKKALPHYEADGFANAFPIGDPSAKLMLSYAPGRAAETDRLISGAAILLMLTALLVDLSAAFLAMRRTVCEA